MHGTVCIVRLESGGMGMDYSPWQAISMRSGVTSRIDELGTSAPFHIASKV